MKEVVYSNRKFIALSDLLEKLDGNYENFFDAMPNIFIRYQGEAVENLDIVDLGSYSQKLLLNENLFESKLNTNLGDGVCDLSLFKKVPETVTVDGLMEYTENEYINLLPNDFLSNIPRKRVNNFVNTSKPEIQHVDEFVKHKKPFYQEIIDKCIAKEPFEINSKNQVFSYGVINNQEVRQYDNALAFKVVERFVKISDLLINEDDANTVQSGSKMDITYGEGTPLTSAEAESNQCVYKQCEDFVKAILKIDNEIESALIIKYFVEGGVLHGDYAPYFKDILEEFGVPRTRVKPFIENDVKAYKTTKKWNKGLFPVVNCKFLANKKRKGTLLCETDEAIYIQSNCAFCCKD